MSTRLYRAHPREHQNQHHKNEATPMTDLMNADTEAQSAALITVTPAALATVIEARSGEVDADALALWLEVGSAPGGRFRYDMWFQRGDEAAADAQIITLDGVTLVVTAGSVDKLRGATLDLASDGSGMVLLNPNEPQPAVAAPPVAVPATADLSSPLAMRVVQVLEEQVNPSIASHGGFAQLIAAEGDTVWLMMGGGCQGCAMSKATLRQGIEVAIKEAVPEILHVVDVTDHQSGDNPFYR